MAYWMCQKCAAPTDFYCHNGKCVNCGTIIDKGKWETYLRKLCDRAMMKILYGTDTLKDTEIGKVV